MILERGGSWGGDWLVTGAAGADCWETGRGCGGPGEGCVVVCRAVPGFCEFSGKELLRVIPVAAVLALIRGGVFNEATEDPRDLGTACENKNLDLQACSVLGYLTA